MSVLPHEMEKRTVKIQDDSGQFN